MSHDLSSIQIEVDASFLYALLAEHEEDENVAKVFREMSEIEMGHALAFLKSKGLTQSDLPQPSGRAKTLKKIGKNTKEVWDQILADNGSVQNLSNDILTEEEKEAAKIKQGRDKYLSVDERIAIQLKTENKAFNVQKFDHPYPHCWRTDKPVLYYPLDSWFIKTTAVKDKLIALNNTINWKPESTGTGRFGNWLENMVDWNLSRSRYW